jgi:hypothetical protein
MLRRASQGHERIMSERFVKRTLTRVLRGRMGSGGGAVAAATVWKPHRLGSISDGAETNFSTCDFPLEGLKSIGNTDLVSRPP